MPKARDLPAPDGSVETSPLCGHVNRHYVNVDQENDELLCTLPSGHDGNHKAPYKCLRPKDGSVRQARAISKGEIQVIQLNGKDYVEIEEIGEWDDLASTPADQIKPDLEQLARIKRTKGDMLDAAQILTRELAAQQAAQALQRV